MSANPIKSLCDLRVERGKAIFHTIHIRLVLLAYPCNRRAKLIIVIRFAFHLFKQLLQQIGHSTVRTTQHTAIWREQSDVYEMKWFTNGSTVEPFRT